MWEEFIFIILIKCNIIAYQVEIIVIFTFSCSQAIDRQLFRKTIFTAAAKARRKVRILHQLSQGPDHPVNIYHPEGEYLKGLVVMRRP